jgi:hypothetical protein
MTCNNKETRNIKSVDDNIYVCMYVYIYIWYEIETPVYI